MPQPPPSLVRRAQPLATWGGEEARTFYLGIDPGSASGGASLVDERGRILINDGRLRSIKFEKSTEHEISDWFAEAAKLPGRLVAALEKVHSMPSQSAQSGFTFGRSYGFLRGMLAAHAIRYVEPRPEVWQKALGCKSGGNKNVTKQAAHQRWPSLAPQITHAIADSLLIADWLRLYGGL